GAPGLRGALRGPTIATVLSFAIAVPGAWVLADATPVKHPAVFVLLLAASSSAVVMPILHERGLTGGGMLLAIAWIALVDIATIVALPLALEPSRALRIAVGGVVVTASAVGIFVVLRAIRRHPVVRTLRDDSRNREWALDLRLSLLALFGLSALATWVGPSVLIAGLQAGVDARPAVTR